MSLRITGCERIPASWNNSEHLNSPDRLTLWQSALDAARGNSTADSESFWDELFERRAENHAAALAKSQSAAAAWRARTAGIASGSDAADAYAECSTEALTAGPGITGGADFAM